MGLSASQARLLSLTARMHDIEYKAQNLEAQKLQMANKSQQVYAEYEDALNRTKVQYKFIGADGSAAHKDATLKSLVVATGEAKSDYIAHNIATNQMYCTYDQIEKYNIASKASATKAEVPKTNTYGQFVDDSGNVVTKADEATKVKTDLTPAQYFAHIMGWAESSSLQALFTEMQECVNAHGGKPEKAFIAVDVAVDSEDENQKKYAPSADVANQFNNPVYLTNMLQEGFIVLHKMTGDGVTAAAEEVNVAVDTSLQEVTDELDLKKAEAKYEADMRKINAKDKKFDVDIAALEQERNAIKTEMDTLKTVAKDNVERTFKLFS